MRGSSFACWQEARNIEDVLDERGGYMAQPRRKVFLKADGIGAWGEQLYSLVFLDTGEDVFPLLGTAESWRSLVEGSLGLVMVEAP